MVHSVNIYYQYHVGFLQKRGRLRPSSAPTYRSKGGYSGKDGTVLYKLFVTTADKKGGGTDAKVKNNFKSSQFLSTCQIQGRIAQSVACLTKEPEVLGSIPCLATYFCFFFS